MKFFIINTFSDEMNFVGKKQISSLKVLSNEKLDIRWQKFLSLKIYFVVVTYGIMYEHVNEWQRSKQETLRENPNLAYINKQT